MKYSDFIDRVNQKVRDPEAWPASGSATAEQVTLSYAAALSVATTLPLLSFPEAKFTKSTLTGATAIVGQLDSYPLPADVFRFRDDLGISKLKLDGFPVTFDQSQPIPAISAAARNPLYKDARMISVDLNNRLIYVHGANKADLRYLTLFPAPAVGDISTTDYPFEGTRAERAGSIVAGHVSGETIRDMAASQFQEILKEVYGEPSRKVAQEES